jgi:hypothetical protein
MRQTQYQRVALDERQWVCPKKDTVFHLMANLPLLVGAIATARSFDVTRSGRRLFERRMRKCQ